VDYSLLFEVVAKDRLRRIQTTLDDRYAQIIEGPGRFG
jgi:hypothetical protein